MEIMSIDSNVKLIDDIIIQMDILYEYINHYKKN